MKLVRWIAASAGTGKTHKINELIWALVSSGVNPSSILCLSFSRSSAFEMQNRYRLCSEGAASRNDAHSPRFETIHSFAKSMLGDNQRVITDEVVDELIREAIEFVIAKDEWMSFFESIHDTWTSMINDIRYFIMHNSQAPNSTLQKYLSKSSSPLLNIELSQSAVKALTRAGLHELVKSILSNDIEIYRNYIITKDFRVNKRLLPDSFLDNPAYSEENKEIDLILKKILNEVMEYTNSSHLRQSVAANLFVKTVQDQYERIKTAQNLMDFSDIIKLAIDALNHSSERLINIKHVFVDEAQDTSEIQWKFLYSIATEVLQVDESSFTVVGDRKQIIYEFNGASRALYDRAKAKLKSMTKGLNGEWQEYELNNSYRAPQLMLDFVDTVMQCTKYPTQHKSARTGLAYVKTWLPLKNDKEQLMIEHGWRIPGEQIIPEWITLCVDEIKALLNGGRLLNVDRQIEPSDIMILIQRRCISTFLLVAELKKHKIPIRESPFSISSDETVQELIGIGEIVLDNTNDLIVACILKGIYFQWTDQQLEALAIDRDDTLLNQILTSSESHAKHAAQLISSWLSLPRDLLTFYSKLIFHSDYGAMMLRTFRNEVLMFWEKVVHFSRTSSSLSEFIHFIKNTNDSISVYRNGVSISTVHGAKGRESQIVFLCNSHISVTRNSSGQVLHDNLLLLRGNYAMYKAAKNKNLIDQENESDRLLYVALTRAQEQLYVLPPLSTDNINPKSWYSKIIRNIHIFNQVDSWYEIGANPATSSHLTKYHKYN